MAVTKVTYHLTGAYAGQTINLGRFNFERGAVTLTGPEKDHEKLARFLERNWQAYPEGHPKLEGIVHGKRDLQAPSGEDEQPAVPGQLQSAGAGATAGEPAAAGPGSAVPDAGGAVQVPNGDGPQAVVNERLSRAVLSLNPENDDHWTQEGKPAIVAVSAAYGSSDVTRADVEASAPGYTRAKARGE